MFILSVANIIEEVQRTFPDVTVVGIADDYRFVGPAQAALDAAAIYRTRVAAAGHAFQERPGPKAGLHFVSRLRPSASQFPHAACVTLTGADETPALVANIPLAPALLALTSPDDDY